MSQQRSVKYYENSADQFYDIELGKRRKQRRVLNISESAEKKNEVQIFSNKILALKEGPLTPQTEREKPKT